MKTIFFILLLSGICQFVYAQEDSLLVEDWQNKIMEQLKADSTLSLELPRNFGEKPFQPYAPDYRNFQKGKRVYHFNMPVARGGFGTNMPVYIPDSTVQYYIKEKRLGAYNPLDRKNIGNKVEK
jgi:hypothetical protein